ncbi:hypothetical protein GCM10007862_34380 [Dyella lipolytica]|uniref:Uncharacterized protein n=1 Tax=Dyella lipolytica TaxID=1867835 RepID=A0ABW8J036_9GAMM|nr:hypothetical protein [Dyella lipolytica]GLQ48387.1 hypothetical protein GCM10007862_34380 [Dyella lipolytica]
MNDQQDDVKPIAVAVITTSGTFPNVEDYRRTYSTEPLSVILKAAAEKLGLTNTSDWEAFVDNRPVDVSKSFEGNALHNIVEIEWHKPEGGGGA